MRHHENSATATERRPQALTLRRLYLQLACARAATIHDFLARSTELPDPPAIALTLAAAELAHVTVAGTVTGATARSAAVSRLLIAEAARHDPAAAALGEQALNELETTGPTDRHDLIHEAIDSLAWACAVLRHCGALLEDSEDGNADQLELAWLCLIEAAELLIALDKVAISEREEHGPPTSGGGARDRLGDGRDSAR
jgi:hypothetical protein